MATPEKQLQVDRLRLVLKNTLWDIVAIDMRDAFVSVTIQMPRGELSVTDSQQSIDIITRVAAVQRWLPASSSIGRDLMTVTLTKV